GCLGKLLCVHAPESGLTIPAADGDEVVGVERAENLAGGVRLNFRQLLLHLDIPGLHPSISAEGRNDVAAVVDDLVDGCSVVSHPRQVPFLARAVDAELICFRNGPSVFVENDDVLDVRGANGAVASVGQVNFVQLEGAAEENSLVRKRDGYARNAAERRPSN